MAAYYNEIEPYAVQWLRNLIAAGLIPPGDVDDRSVADVDPVDLIGYDQCHFFAGLGGWAYAARLAGWPDDRPLWSGSCPCQPFSGAGSRSGFDDERHLWPEWFRLIRACRPPVVVGEQVAAAVGFGWLDRVFVDLEGQGYAGRAAVLPACAVDAPHRRDRLWFVADTGGGGLWRGGCAPASGTQGSVPAAAREQRVRADAGPGGSDRDSRSLADTEEQRFPARPRLARGHLGAHEPQRLCARCRGVADPHVNGCPAAPVGSASAERDAEPCGALVDAACVGRGERRPEHEISVGWPTVTGAGGAGRAVGDADGAGSSVREQQQQPGTAQCGVGPGAATCERGGSSFWSDAEWVHGADGKSRRVKPGIRLLAHGVPARVAKLRALGNAIVPEVAAEILAAYLEAEIFY